jgi:hypothetical protein
MPTCATIVAGRHIGDTFLNRGDFVFHKFLPTNKLFTLRTDTQLSRTGNRQSPATTTTLSFVVNLNLVGQVLVIAMVPHPVEGESGRSVRTNPRLAAVEVVLFVEDSAQEAIAGSVIGTVEKADEVWGILRGLTHLEGEPDTGLFGSHGKDCLARQDEFLSLNHTDNILMVYSFVKRLFELFA